MNLLLIILLLLFVYVLYSYRRVLLGAYKLHKGFKQAKQEAEEERKRQERVRRHTAPPQSSVDMIDDAALDLEGGEYVDYEEVKE